MNNVSVPKTFHIRQHFGPAQQDRIWNLSDFMRGTFVWRHGIIVRLVDVEFTSEYEYLRALRDSLGYEQFNWFNKEDGIRRNFRLVLSDEKEKYDIRRKMSYASTTTYQSLVETIYKDLSDIMKYDLMTHKIELEMQMKQIELEVQKSMFVPEDMMKEKPWLLKF